MRPRIVSIGGGKGGVGKSLIAANLAIALAQMGRRTYLVDADLGAANQHTLFGLERPGPSLHGLFTKEIAHLSEAAVATPVMGLQLIRGSGAVVGAANIVHTQKQKLIRQIQSLDADVVVVDVGAGVSFNVLDLYDLADLRLVVATPQLTAVQNAYGFLKGAVHRAIGAHLTAEVGLNGPGDRETDRLPDRLLRLAERHPEVAERCVRELDLFGARLIGNQLGDPGEVGVFHAMSRMLRDFLGIAVPVLGTIAQSARLHESVNRRRPFLLDYRYDPVARTFRTLAELLLADDVSAISEQRRRSRFGGGRGAIDEELPELEPYSRRHDRHPVAWPATLTPADGPERAVEVREISLGGALVEGAGPYRMGEALTLSVPRLDTRLPVAVRSLRTGGAGVEFLVAGELPARLVQAALDEGRPLQRQA